MSQFVSFNRPEPKKTNLVVSRLIKINAIAFGFWVVLSAFLGCLNSSTYSYEKIANYFVLDSRTQFQYPWTLFTYVFTYAELSTNSLWYLCFSMGSIYFFGSMVVRFMHQYHLIIIYILGTIGTGLLKMICDTYIPLLQSNHSIVYGPSPVIHALILMITLYAPNHCRYLFFIPIRLKYMALVTLGSQLIALGQQEVHALTDILGSIIGAFYGLILRRIHIRNTRDAFVKFKQKSRVQPENQDTSQEESLTDIDAILDKVSRTGYKSLTHQEKLILFEEGPTV